MKNPIRAWVAKIAREEIQEELRRRNQDAIRHELKMAEAWARGVRAEEHNRQVDLRGAS